MLKWNVILELSFNLTSCICICGYQGENRVCLGMQTEALEWLDMIWGRDGCHKVWGGLDYPGNSNTNNPSFSSFALMIMEKSPMYYKIGSRSLFLSTGQEKEDMQCWSTTLEVDNGHNKEASALQREFRFQHEF